MEAATAKLIIDNWEVVFYILGTVFTFFLASISATWAVAWIFFKGRTDTHKERADFFKEQLETYVSLVGPLKEATKAMIQREQQRQEFSSSSSLLADVEAPLPVGPSPLVIKDVETTATATANVAAVESFEEAFLKLLRKGPPNRTPEEGFGIDIPEIKTLLKKD